MNVIGFRCLATDALLGADYDSFVSPAGANLDIVYDEAALRAAVADGFPPAGGRQDLFAYLPFLPLESTASAPPLRVGATPLYHAERLGAAAGLPELFIKDDGLQPSGSFKDRASAVVLAKARELNVEVVAAASTGNAGSSIACLAASVGMPCVVFVPESAPVAKLTQLLVFGAHVLAVRGTYDDAFDLCEAMCEARGWFNRNTGYNPYTREGKKTVSYEIYEQLGRRAPDRVLVCVGDGNIISGVWKGFRDLQAAGLIDRLPKIDCCQSAQSDAISRTIRAVQDRGQEGPVDWSAVDVASVRATTLADSISVDRPRDGLAGTRAVVETGGNALTVDDAAIGPAQLELARLSGVFVEPSAAVVWACLRSGVEHGLVDPGETTVCLFTGNGLKDVARAREAAGEPTVIDNDIAAAHAAADKLFA